ncbi:MULTISPECIES: MaoC/PaaZ C-terminal domain-containing protein [Hydrogenophaga]|jgi:acyl dehydratase|uniref:Acyl dehydratase n=1 Tax=Hydrogenophaga intermedia TaxID=65786 RepID=A0A1L1PLQ8_HYDIT|nr:MULTISPECIES: MaoC/PaaZ C-terminal domain-containing protein [Hydrogenophaga]AOS78084.1 acyl dehydratase [Hydrogenophaga sp. PBC]TMU76269.1 acyl dehydratase [Hydrogenophaga intermedia]CDN89734.1 Acyl dehydratase [Hydrogenophaga intermedia]
MTNFVEAPPPAELAALRYWWEDLKPGLRWRTTSRTITEADVVQFATYSGDLNRAHVDAEYAAQLPLYGQRLVHGMLVVSYMAGLSTRTMVNQMLEPSLLGLLEVRCQFPAPTFIGDTLAVDIEVMEQKETSKPERGVVTFKRTAVNQRGQAVVECLVTQLVMRRPAA